MASFYLRLQIVVLVLSAAGLASAPLLHQASGAAQDEPTWTVMVYMAADSEPALPWEEDINEMESADLPDWIDVVVLADPLGTGDSTILEIVEDDGPAVVSPLVDDSGQVIPLEGEVDMASPETLIDFVAFTAANYPADRLALVLWGHGGGWYGLCADGLSILTLPDLGYALGSATDEIGRALDLVVADSCTEGVLETMYEIRGAADWYVGSEITVPAQGLRYDLVLDALAADREVSPADWGADICEIHRATLYYDSWSAAMAVYDLGALETFAGRLADLSSSLGGFKGLYGEALSDILNQTARSDFTEWYLDMGDALERLASVELPLDIRYQALQALLAYDNLVYAFELYASPYDDEEMMSDYTGAVAYAPSDASADGSYWSVAFSEVGWGDATSIIRGYAPPVADQPGPELSYEDTDSDGRPDEATLHWTADHDLHTALVFAETPAGMQLVASSESDAPDLVISGVMGELVVSASAWDLGTVVSHDETELVLFGDVDVSVRVISEGLSVTDVDVRIITDNGTVELDMAGGCFTGEIRVPEDAAYGELLTVEVLGSDGQVLGQNRSYVQGSDVVLEVSITPESLPGPYMTPYLAAAIGVCVVLVAAYVLVRRGRGRRSS